MNENKSLEQDKQIKNYSLIIFNWLVHSIYGNPLDLDYLIHLNRTILDQHLTSKKSSKKVLF